VTKWGRYVCPAEKPAAAWRRRRQGRGGALRFPRATFGMCVWSPSGLQRWRMERAALITGGSSGIGLAIGRALREDGFQLTLASRTREKVESAAEQLGALAVTADVSDEADCRRLVDEHRARHGRLDVLVNSAGVGIAGGLDDLSTKQIDVQLKVNLRGLMLVTAAALP